MLTFDKQYQIPNINKFNIRTDNLPYYLVSLLKTFN